MILPPVAARSNPLLRCFRFYAEVPWLLTGFLLLAAVVQGTSPLVQTMVGRAFDDLVNGKAVVVHVTSLDIHVALVWAAILIGANLVRGLLGWIGNVTGMALGQRVLTSLRDRILVQVQRLDLGWHRRHGSGEIITRTTRDADKVRDALIGGFRQIADMTFVVVASLIALFYFHPLLAVVPALAIAIAVVVVISQVGRLVVLDRRVGDAYDHVVQDLGEGVIGARVIKAFALEDERILRFETAVQSFISVSRSALRYTSIRIPLPQMIVACAHVWVLGIGAWYVADQTITVGTLASAVMVMQALVFRVEPLGRLMQTFADARSSAARIVELLDTEPAFVSGSQSIPAGELGIRLRDVIVRDPQGNIVLNGIHMALMPGEVVAIVGATGSGKSTLAELLPRLRDPDAGVVELITADGSALDLTTCRLDELRRRVQIAFQDGFLFSDTLASNLRLADPKADDERLRWALHQASAGDLEQILIGGLQARIGERGVTLSGGQRQRVCLARTILANPAVVCFDDATSALDAVTERVVLDRLRENSGRSAVLLVASKLSTVRLADRVLVLDQGRIVANGPHDDLLANNRIYRDLVGQESSP